MSKAIHHKVEQLICVSCGGNGAATVGACGFCRGSGRRGRKLDGYYIGFEPTGNFAIDKILGAVACAGKAYHHTDSWNDETSPYDDHNGRNPNEWIQSAANEAAATLKEPAK
jgi:hypothetical protein